MSPALMIPTRLTVADLAAALDTDPEKIQASLAIMGEHQGLEDLVDGETATIVARGLGRKLKVEPRDSALEALYGGETSGTPPEPGKGRAALLIKGVTDRREGLDKEIEAASDHWSVARMPVVDRSILRIGLFELLEEDDVPTAVIISEAVRLAKTYSTERSAAFVNGVLATLAREVRG